MTLQLYNRIFRVVCVANPGRIHFLLLDLNVALYLTGGRTQTQQPKEQKLAELSFLSVA